MEKRKSKNGRHRNIEMRRRAKKSKVSILLFVYFSPSQLEEEIFTKIGKFKICFCKEQRQEQKIVSIGKKMLEILGKF